MIWLIFFLSRYCRLGNEKTYLSAVLVWEFFSLSKLSLSVILNFEEIFASDELTMYRIICWSINSWSFTWLKPTTTWKVFVFEVFVVGVYPHSDWIGKDTLYFSVFRANARKYGPKKLGIWTLFKKLTGFSIYVLHPACTLNHLCELWR